VLLGGLLSFIDDFQLGDDITIFFFEDGFKGPFNLIAGRPQEMGTVRIKIKVDLNDQRLFTATSFNFQFEPSPTHSFDALHKFSNNCFVSTHESLRQLGVSKFYATKKHSAGRLVPIIPAGLLAIRDSW
jgi:hypothetical protein